MNGHENSGFSLLELVIVVVIIGIIAAIAVPRLSRGSVGAADAALIRDLDIMRAAIDLYAAEHGGTRPGADVVNQLTQYTDALGAVSATKDVTHIYGPYLRRIPPMPVGQKKGATAFYIETNANGLPEDGGDDQAWWYNTKTGDLQANLKDADVDASGKPYNTY